MRQLDLSHRASAVRHDMFVAAQTLRPIASLGATRAAPMGLVSTVVTKAYNHFAPLALLAVCLDLPTKARQVLQE